MESINFISEHECLRGGGKIVINKGKLDTHKGLMKMIKRTTFDINSCYLNNGSTPCPENCPVKTLRTQVTNKATNL